jgi:hypothetical protein
VKATLHKADLMEEQNLLILMTTPNGQVTAPAAVRFLQLRQEEELEKLLDRMAADKVQKEKENEDREKAKLDAEMVELE